MKPNDRVQTALLSIPLDFDLAYLILLTESGTKPLSRWEGILPGGIEGVMEELGLQFAHVRRRLKDGNSTTELVFSKSDAHLDLYLRYFDGSLIDKSIETQRLEGFLFGFPPCCVESFAHSGYRPNGLGDEVQRLLFHWACPDCHVTPLLLPAYRSVHQRCSGLLSGHRSLVTQNQKQVAKKVVAAVSVLGLVATGAALFSSASAHTPTMIDDDPHWLPWPSGMDNDLDFVPDDTEQYLGVQVNNPDTDGDGVLDGVGLAHAAHAIYALLPHDLRSDTPYVVDHMVWGLETCGICGSTVNMGVAEIVNPMENLVIEVPYIALHYLEHGSFQYAGDVHGSSHVHIRKLKAVLEGDGTVHRLPVQNDDDQDGLTDKVESRFGCKTGEPDSDGDGIPDGVQLARQMWTEIEALPRQVSATPYRLEHEARGIETCDVCGLEVNMGYAEIINPAEAYSLQVPYLSLHYLQHGSFVARGSTHTFEQYDPRTLDCVLHADGSTHLLPIEDDADSDGLTSAEEMHFSTLPGLTDTDADGCVDGAEISRVLAAKVDSLPRTPQADKPYRIDMLTNGLEECEICGEVVNMGFVEAVNPTLRDSLAIPFVGLHAMQHAGFSYDGTVHDGRADPVRLAALLEVGPSTPVQISEGAVPAGCALLQCYPNPFNPTTTIRYSVGELGSRQQAAGNRVVRLAVYDLLGREVAVLVDEKKEPGSYEVQFDGSGLAGGVYVARLIAGNGTAKVEYSEVTKLILLK